MGFHKSNLLQHVLTSQILMDRIRVHRFTLQLMECILQRQDLCGCTVSFVLYAVVPQMDPKCAATLVRIDILQNDFAHRHDPAHDRQMRSAQISLPFPVFVGFCSNILIWTKIPEIFKQIRIVFVFSKIYSI